MMDRAGSHLEVGDKVLYLQPGTSSSWLVWGVVDRFTPKMVVFKDKHGDDIRRDPRSVVKPGCVYDCSHCHPDDDD